MAEVVILPDAEAAGALVADMVARRVAEHPDLVLGVATGSTPTPVYDALACATPKVSFDRAHAFALDEYVGLPEGHPESYRMVLERVLEPLGIVGERLHAPDGDAIAAASAGERYEAEIEASGGIDLQLLGIGSDGHIGFNEPGSSFASRTRIKTLTEQTRSDNSRFFASLDEVPRHCVTQGLGTILQAGHLVLLAFGEGKAAAVAAAVEGALSANCPASTIQLHPKVTVVVDEAAASQLRHADYYRFAFAGKPDWQTL